MYNANIETIRGQRIMRYSLTQNDQPLTYGEVINHWRGSNGFRDYFTQLLADSPFAAFRWETPALCENNVQQPFEFVLLNAPEFCHRETEWETFEDYFTDTETDAGVVAFPNLGRNATLIVPSPRVDQDVYGHLASFIRGAPAAQVDALWRVMANVVTVELCSDPLWLSTAGGGVAWLHVRLDSTPKYYGYEPYRHL